MRTLSTKKLFSVAAAALCGVLGGCAQVGDLPGATIYADEVQLPNLGVPACADVSARPAGPVALEDISGSTRMVVHVGDVSLCAGTLQEIEESGLLVGNGIADPKGRIADSDPMPADGQSPAGDSDPMPADGGKRAQQAASDSDPMPADGMQINKHTSARSGTPPSLPR